MKKNFFVGIFEDLQAELVQEAEKRAPELVDDIARQTLKSLLKLGDRIVSAPQKLPKKGKK